MEKTPRGTSVGVDDPYAFAGVCDHLTSDGKCRYAFDHYQHDPEFARERAAANYACVVANADGDCSGCRDANESMSDKNELSPWATCPHFRSRTTERECARCGLEEHRLGQVPDESTISGERPLLEEHHLSYARDGEAVGHEITIYLCRWCHAKVHNSWARITDDVAPDPEALAEREGRRSLEQSELGFETAADRAGRSHEER
ncbi:DUF7097 family protein [Natronosalvus halobius]|uniref:DUF7097 family protein n=1 Tax=Natronosalvus halobius TaxID=2953746 RepID=UPI0020A08458|nr:hypothetical protein [Natronosalvus halobius]USZ72564.1 hypothetical protein NGM15_04415 [Natronosalvus halobius]